MNEKNIIAALQIAYVNVNNILFADTIHDSKLSVDEKFEFIKQNCKLDFISQGITAMTNNLNFIKGISPSDEKVKKIHEELKKLFEENIQVLEDINSLNGILTKESGEGAKQREEVLDRFGKLIEKNGRGVEGFNEWNDSMRGE